MEPLYLLAFSQIGNLTGYKHISTGHEAEGLWASREVVVLPPRVSREPWLPCPLGNCLQVGFAIVLCYKSYTHPQSFLWTWCLSYHLSLCLFLSHICRSCVFFQIKYNYSPHELSPVFIIHEIFLLVHKTHLFVFTEILPQCLPLW